MTIDAQITEALHQAEIAIMKHERLRSLTMRSAEIKAAMGNRDRMMSEGTRRRLLSCILIGLANEKK